MAKDIKTHTTQKTVKTLKGTVKVLDRSLRAGRDVKGAIRIASRSEEQTPENAPADLEEYSVIRNGQVAVRGGQRFVKASAHSAVRIKQRQDIARQSIKTVKPTIKAVGTTVKQGAQAFSTSVKTTKNMIKTASAGVKTGTATKSTVSAAKATAEGTKLVAQTSIQTAKATAKAVAEAVKVLAEATKATIEAISSFIAAGGWIAVLILVIAALFVALLSSALGVHFADETQGNALSNAQQTLNSEFVAELNQQKAKLTGYNHIVVRPAPTITQWNYILAVYAVRAQTQNLPAIEITEETTDLLRTTMWDMISFTTTSETITSVETDENGNEITVSEEYGVVTVTYKTTEEMAEQYHFSANDREMLTEVISLYSEMNGIYIGGAGNGEMVNPCPGGQFNGNDYPAYAGSGEYHAGRDISCPIGTPVYAVADGIVIHINDQAASYGNHIMIAHGNEVYSLYAHCDTILVSVGQEVKQGQQIATSGATGNVTGPHLHFEVRVGGDRYRINNVDPLDWIS